MLHILGLGEVDVLVTHETTDEADGFVRHGPKQARKARRRTVAASGLHPLRRTFVQLWLTLKHRAGEQRKLWAARVRRPTSVG
jgi:hypothetical protein